MRGPADERPLAAAFTKFLPIQISTGSRIVSIESVAPSSSLPRRGFSLAATRRLVASEEARPEESQPGGRGAAVGRAHG